MSSAANTARSAAESVLKRHFYKNRVEIPYKKKQKEYSFEDFWRKACALEQSGGILYIDATLKRRLEGARALVLNPASHDPTVPLTTNEVWEAIDAVNALAAAFGISSP